jgi:hypothetical protein
MAWKNWPYWLRGGLIGLVIGIWPLGQFLVIPTNLLLHSMGFYFGIKSEVVYLGYVLLHHIILGALIGLLIGEIKSRKNKGKIPNSKL